MRVDVGDPEAERDNGEKAVGLAKKFADMKQNLVGAGLDSCSLRHGMVQHAVRLEPALGHACSFRFDPPDFHAETLGRTATCHIDGVDGNSPCHLILPLFNAVA